MMELIHAMTTAHWVAIVVFTGAIATAIWYLMDGLGNNDYFDDVDQLARRDRRHDY